MIVIVKYFLLQTSQTSQPFSAVQVPFVPETSMTDVHNEVTTSLNEVTTSSLSSALLNVSNSGLDQGAGNSSHTIMVLPKLEVRKKSISDNMQGVSKVLLHFCKSASR